MTTSRRWPRRRAADCGRRVAGPARPIPSEDGQAVQVVVPLPGDNTAFETLPGIVEDVTAAAESRVCRATSPDPAVSSPTSPRRSKASTASLLVHDRRLVVLVILLLVYRSPVFVPVLLSAGLALATRPGRRLPAGEDEVITLDGQSAGILPVLVFGAGTDYALLLISRFREELHHEGPGRYAGGRRAPRARLLASGATVVLGLLCLLLSDLNSNRSLGPDGAMGIVSAMLSR